MTSTPITIANTFSEGSKFTGPIIDTDIHETFSSWHDLVPYLKEPWRGLIVNGSWKGAIQLTAHWASHGVNRVDANPPSGAAAGSSYELLKEQVLDLYPIKYGILTGQFMPGIMPMQLNQGRSLSIDGRVKYCVVPGIVLAMM